MNQIEVVFIVRNTKKQQPIQLRLSSNHLHLLRLHLGAGVEAACSSAQRDTGSSNSICGLAPLHACA